MTIRNYFFLFVLLSLVNKASAQVGVQNQREREMIDGWERAGKLPFDLRRAFLIAELTHDTTTLTKFEDKFNAWLSRHEKPIQRKRTIQDKARHIYKALHEELFAKYDPYATVSSLFDTKAYGCLSANIIFYLTCTHFGIPTLLYTSPGHLFSAIPIGSRTLNVELTDPKNGFDFTNQEDEYISYLLTYKIITEEELRIKGPSIIYREIVLDARRAEPIELLSMIYSNKASLLATNKNLEDAYSEAEKSTIFSPQIPEYQNLYKLYFGLLLKQRIHDVEFSVSITERSMDRLHNDTDFVTQVCPAFLSGIEVLASKSKDYQSAQSRANATLSKLIITKRMQEEIDNFQINLTHQWAISLYNRGQYDEAWKKIRTVVDHSDSKEYQETYVQICAAYAYSEAQKGRIEFALHLLDSLDISHFEYPILRQTYGIVAMSYGSISGSTKTNLASAKEILLKASQIDRENMTLKKMLLAIYP